jgi:hypothetical protein
MTFLDVFAYTLAAIWIWTTLKDWKYWEHTR